uniref:Peptidase A2 domain-containing protein n=1 Tax=Phlebotomus papatasi TaxID=29031 RepID=A0A1B0D076_PHLPP
MDKYNLPPFKCALLPPDEARDKRNQLMALGGFALQRIFHSLPGARVEEDDDGDIDPYAVAIEKLDEYFAPKRHDVFKRNVFWSMKLGQDESLFKFLMRIQEQAVKCNFGSSDAESRAAGIIDKMMLAAPDELREKLLTKSKLSLDTLIKMRTVEDSKKRRVRVIEDEDSKVAMKDGDAFIFNIGDGDEYVWCKIGGVLVEMLIDSGSTHNVIDEKTWLYMKKSGLEVINSTTECNEKLKAYGQNSHLKIVGQFEAVVMIEDNGKDVRKVLCG